jgi:DNA anti-recombination protein RmuC
MDDDLLKKANDTIQELETLYDDSMEALQGHIKDTTKELNEFNAELEDTLQDLVRGLNALGKLESHLKGEALHQCIVLTEGLTTFCQQFIQRKDDRMKYLYDLNNLLKQTFIVRFKGEK